MSPEPSNPVNPFLLPSTSRRHDCEERTFGSYTTWTRESVTT
jgi:hypothetical protein